MDPAPREERDRRLPDELAERVGFEPTVRFPAHTLSKRAPSATRTPLRSQQTYSCHIHGMRGARAHDRDSGRIPASGTTPEARFAPGFPIPQESVGGEGGIRTHGPLTGSTVFETAPFSRSGTSPRSRPTPTMPLRVVSGQLRNYIESALQWELDGPEICPEHHHVKPADPRSIRSTAAGAARQKNPSESPRTVQRESRR
jgi:hypothetical protein